MGLSLLFPLGLAALAAWLVPLLIHLARRQESRLTEFAALRWLRAEPRPRQRIRIDEWPLLLVRLLLLALLALLLAALAWRDDDDRRPRVLVAPGIEAAAQRALHWPQDARLHWLARGFPALDTPAPAGTQPVASLLREFDAQLPAGAPLTVVVPADWGAVDAQRPVLSRPVRWQVLPGASPGAARAQTTPLKLAVFGAEPGGAALRTLRALQAAWQVGDTVAVLPVSDEDRPDAARLPAGTLAVRLRADALPGAWLDWVRAGGELLIAPSTAWPAEARGVPQWRDDTGDVVLASARLGRGRLWQLPQGLDPAASPRVREAGFAHALASVLRPAAVPSRVAAADFAPVHQARAWPRMPQPLAPLLALLIALLFALERWLATAPRRSAVA